ncbi:hypothetical protein ACHHYP_02742 [Achlya hypogyna]|uniref:SUEL-type lectin domain-containing protein n=1 Tax=Achlya hypogyna TaxID=1202772 RepID=A0A1V9Z5H0_ACHHY|nr:hypothetical protein ACHHYP_02742 [Achlya hypogyna]
MVYGDEILNLQCADPSATITKVLFASYGLSTGTGLAAAIDPSCHADSSQGVVESSCLGKQSCSVTANDEVFGDPCFGEYKHLTVTAACGSKPSASVATTTPPADQNGSLGAPADDTGSSVSVDPTVAPLASQSGENVPTTTPPADQNGSLGAPADDTGSLGASQGLSGQTFSSPSSESATLSSPPEQTIVAKTVDEHQTLKLQCVSPDLVITSVLFASYGMPTGTGGAAAISQSCHAVRSKEIVESSCLGKKACLVAAENSVFGDPCFGIFKHLTVAAKCGTEVEAPTLAPGHSLVTATVDEHQTLDLVCKNPSDKIARVLFASYGMPTGTGHDATTSSCHAGSSQGIVESACIDKPSCTVTASNSVFGDPCEGTFKHLTVTAECAPTTYQTWATTDEGKTLDVSCKNGYTISSIDFASYGNPAVYSQGWCHAPSSVNIVSSLCVGQESCSVPAVNGLFTDPCVGTVKTLAAKATCAPGKAPPAITTEFIVTSCNVNKPY